MALPEARAEEAERRIKRVSRCGDRSGGGGGGKRLFVLGEWMRVAAQLTCGVRAAGELLLGVGNAVMFSSYHEDI